MVKYLLFYNRQNEKYKNLKRKVQKILFVFSLT